MARERSPNQFAQTRRDHLRSLIGGSAALLGIAGSGSACADTGDEYDNLCFTPVTVLAERIHAGELSPVDLVEVFLDRIERRDDDINAFVTLTTEPVVAASEAYAQVNPWRDNHTRREDVHA